MGWSFVEVKGMDWRWGLVTRPCQATVQQMQYLGSQLAPNIWNVLNEQVFIHCSPLTWFLGAEACTNTMGM